jgi:tetratricopeptide (TPR) repeat protein
MDIALIGLIASVVAFRMVGMSTGRQASGPLDRKKFLAYLAVIVVLFGYCVFRSYGSIASAKERQRQEQLADLDRKAALLLLGGQAAEASSLGKKAVEVADLLHGPQDPRLIPYLRTYSRALIEQGKYSEAEAVELRCLALATQHFGEDHEEVALCENDLGAVYEGMGRLDQAEVLFRKAVAKTESVRIGLIPKVLPTALDNLASVCERTGKAEEAARLRERARNLRPRQ